MAIAQSLAEKDARRAWCATEDGQMGVVAAEDIPAGGLVEVCYCLPVKPSDLPGEHLKPWLYDRGLGGDSPLLLPLGWGLLYNEVQAGGVVSNLTLAFEEVPDAQGESRHYIVLRAAYPLKRGEELCVTRRNNGTGALRDIVQTRVRMLQSKGAPSSYSAMQLRPLPRHLVEASRLTPLLAPTNDRVQMAYSALHGIGGFAKIDFEEGQVVEVIPSLVFIDDEFSNNCIVEAYVVDDETVKSPFPVSRLDIGFGAIYNSHTHPNIEWHEAESFLPAEGMEWIHHTCIVFVAVRDIAAGEELLVEYGWEYWWRKLVQNPMLTRRDRLLANIDAAFSGASWFCGHAGDARADGSDDERVSSSEAMAHTVPMQMQMGPLMN